MKELTSEEAAEKIAGKSPKGKPVEPIRAIPAPVAAEVPCLELWSVEDVIPTPDNPRRPINKGSAAFLELVESVRSLGILQPLVARLHPEEPGKLDLRAGHRRHAAAVEAGLPLVPVMVRVMDDRVAMEITVLENLQREDLTPMEEARGVDALRRTGHDLDDIAARMGKSRQWIHRRAQLLELTGAWRNFAEDWKISAAHLEMIARLPKEVQDGIFEQLTEDEYTRDECFFDPRSLAQLRAKIAEELRELKLAPWALDNTVLVPKAGACDVCPKRSGCQPDLFSEAEDGGDRCLDSECWQGKLSAWKKLREAELRKEHPGLVIIEGDGPPYNTRDKRALKSWEFTECKKAAEGAVPAMIAGGKGEGMLTWVKLERTGGKGTRETVRKNTPADKLAKASLDPAESAALLQEKIDAHEKRRWAWVAERLREILKDMVLPAAEEFRSAEGLCRLVAAFQTDTQGTIWVADRKETWKALADGFGQETKERVWQLVKGRIDSTLVVYKVSDIGPETHVSIQGACMLLGLDIANLKEQADREIPEPKSWEGLRKLAEAPAAAPAEPVKVKRVAKGKGGKVA